MDFLGKTTDWHAKKQNFLEIQNIFLQIAFQSLGLITSTVLVNEPKKDPDLYFETLNLKICISPDKDSLCT